VSFGAAIAASVGAPPGAHAQPAEPPGAPEGNQSSRAPAAPAIDEAKVRELVDRELAQVLTERAVKEAAERAAKEAADKEATAGEETGELRAAAGSWIPGSRSRSPTRTCW
jgi:hypothetical protein